MKELIERSPLAERYSITVNKNNGVRPRPLAGQRRGTVYFMRFGDLIKIGYSADLRQRLKALRPDSVLATMPGTMQDERALHARFGPLWDHGEYFRAEPELMAYIDEVRATQDTRQPA